jgi:hypothetical protein
MAGTASFDTLQGLLDGMTAPGGKFDVPGLLNRVGLKTADSGVAGGITAAAIATMKANDCVTINRGQPNEYTVPLFTSGRDNEIVSDISKPLSSRVKNNLSIRYERFKDPFRVAKRNFTRDPITKKQLTKKQVANKVAMQFAGRSGGVLLSTLPSIVASPAAYYVADKLYPGSKAAVNVATALSTAGQFSYTVPTWFTELPKIKAANTWAEMANVFIPVQKLKIAPRIKNADVEQAPAIDVVETAQAGEHEET